MIKLLVDSLDCMADGQSEYTGRLFIIGWLLPARPACLRFAFASLRVSPGITDKTREADHKIKCKM